MSYARAYEELNKKRRSLVSSEEEMRLSNGASFVAQIEKDHRKVAEARNHSKDPSSLANSFQSMCRR